jgi:hypothetical protein
MSSNVSNTSSTLFPGDRDFNFSSRKRKKMELDRDQREGYYNDEERQSLKRIRRMGFTEAAEAELGYSSASPIERFTTLETRIVKLETEVADCKELLQKIHSLLKKVIDSEADESFDDSRTPPSYIN